MKASRRRILPLMIMAGAAVAALAVGVNRSGGGSAALHSPSTVPYGVALPAPLDRPHVLGTSPLCVDGSSSFSVTNVRWKDGGEAVPISGYTLRPVTLGGSMLGEDAGSLTADESRRHSLEGAACADWKAGSRAAQLVLEVPALPKSTGGTASDLVITFVSGDSKPTEFVEPFTVSICGPAAHSAPGC